MYKVTQDGLEYYSIDRLKDIQNQMLKLLKIIDTICRANNFRYWLDGGTAIGAYRHNGFIPWDDDLDINILKPDYLKLMEILKNLDKKKYFLFDYNMEIHPAAFFGEKVDFFSCFDEIKRHIYPIKIDIIPMNIIENTEECRSKNRVYRELANLLFLGKCNDDYLLKVNEVFQSEFRGSLNKFMSFYNYEYGLFDRYENAVISRPTMSFSTPKVYEYQEMFPLREISFSGMTTFVPKTDTWLIDTYGDYMMLPELEDRKPEAYRVFDAKSGKSLYPYLINKKPKSFWEKLGFSLQAELLCK